jgi:hypothetical protein
LSVSPYMSPSVPLLTGVLPLPMYSAFDQRSSASLATFSAGVMTKKRSSCGTSTSSSSLIAASTLASETAVPSVPTERENPAKSVASAVSMSFETA